MNNNDVPIWEKYTLTIEEAAKYFRIGESKLRKQTGRRKSRPGLGNDERKPYSD